MSFARKYRKQVLDTGLDAQKTASKKVVHNAAKATGESIRNKTEDAVTKWKVNKIVKQKPVTDENLRNIEEIIIPPENREEILNKLRQVI